MIRRLSIFLNIVLIGFFAWYFFIHQDIRAYYQRYFDPREDFLENVYYRARVSSYAALNRSVKDTRVVFAGDSLVEQFPVHELLPEAGALNRGIGLDTSNGILLRLDSNINNLKVSKFFLLVGHNDIKYRTVQEAAQNIALIFSKVDAAEKYFISIPPTADREQNTLISELNDAVRLESRAGGFKYIDLYCKFLDACASPDARFFYDGVHLNVEGYRVLARGLEGSLKGTR
jgi:lysophospholipase L1-like esterase